MARERRFSSLEDMAERSLRSRTVPEIPTCQSAEDAYRAALERAGVTSKWKIKEYLFHARHAREEWEMFAEDHPDCQSLIDLGRDFAWTCAKYDTRDPDRITYSAEAVLCVVFLAGLCGCRNCQEYALFWLAHNPLLQCLFDMPGPCCMISDEEIRLILRMVPSDAFEDFFRRRFAEFRKADPDLSKDTAEEGGFMRTIGGDGQELRASYRRGESSRHKKGMQGVTLFDCDSRTVKDYTTVQKKNQEVDAFTKMLERVGLENGQVVFYADALNTRAPLVDFLNKRGIDWLFPVKNNGGNKELREGIEKAFEEHKGEAAAMSEAGKTGGRVEERTYSFLPASVLPGGQAFDGSGTIVMVDKRTEFPRNGSGDRKLRRAEHSRICYISSLPYSDGNNRQIKHSLSVRWLYEQHHNTIDEVLLQDRQALCDENHLSTVIGLNKCLYNVLTFARAKLSAEGMRMTKYRSEETKRRARLLSYKATTDLLADDMLLAVECILEYFSA